MNMNELTALLDSHDLEWCNYILVRGATDPDLNWINELTASLGVYGLHRTQFPDGYVRSMPVWKLAMLAQYVADMDGQNYVEEV